MYYPDEGVKLKRLYNTFLISTRGVVVLYTFNKNNAKYSQNQLWTEVEYCHKITHKTTVIS